MSGEEVMQKIREARLDYFRQRHMEPKDVCLGLEECEAIEQMFFRWVRVESEEETVLGLRLHRLKSSTGIFIGELFSSE